MTRRTYNQVCSVAGALDLIGERWTLLLIRELLTGPKRYVDLLEGLRGIGTNLLAGRLKSLVADGIVQQRTLPAPSGSTVYELTEAGLELEVAMLEIIRWGLRHQRRPKRGALYRSNWSMLAMRAVFRPERAEGIRVECRFKLDDHVFFALVDDATLTTGQGEGFDPDVIVTTDEKTYRKFEAGASLDELAATRKWKVDGSHRALELFMALFAVPETKD